MKRFILISFGFLSIFSFVGWQFSGDLYAKSSAHSTMRHCGMGEVMAGLQAIEMGFVHWNPFLGESGNAGLGDWFDCQYRLWSPLNVVTGAHWMFCEEDIFLAGSIPFLIAYQSDPFCDQSLESCADGATCPIEGESCVDTFHEASAILDFFTQTATFGPEGGELKLQEMIRTPKKNVHDPVEGNLIWFQDGFILHELPGIYRSELAIYFDGFPFDFITVVIEVVDHEEHEARVANGTWK